jgi:N-acetylmuramoyl-L-alanine amidase
MGAYRNIKYGAPALVLLAVVCALAGWLFLSPQTPETIETAGTPLSGKVIVVDAGHGGYDSGAVGTETGVLEKDLNLSVAIKLRDLLVQGGASVLMTRDSDIALCPDGTPEGKKKTTDMALRAGIINEADADVVLSIHMNKFTLRRYYGAQVFYSQEDETGQGAALAKAIQDAMREGLDPNNTRREKSGDYYILRMRPASVLVECGFLSNKAEEALLCDQAYQEKIAWSIYAGLLDYYRQQ